MPTQVILELELSEVARAEITNALYRREIAAEPSPRWAFVMISPDQVRLVMRLIQERVQRPDTTHRVFIAALTHVRMDTGEIMADRPTLAADALTTPAEVSRAFCALTELGVLIRHRRRRTPVYFINPTIGWAGSEANRQAAVHTAPQLKVVKHSQ